MMNLCENSVCKPLLIIFNDFLNQGEFLSKWKKAKAVPVRKYAMSEKFYTISLMFNFNKLFECLVYNKMFNFFY